MNASIQTGLSAPLRVRPDMPALWRNIDTDFDTAAQMLAEAHKQDGTAEDVPIMDLRTWAIRSAGGHFALSHLAGSEAPLVLRQTAFSHLSARVGAPVDYIKRLPAELQLANLNYLLASHERPLSSQLRLRGAEVSAIVSERYAALDAEQFVESIRSALQEHGLLDEVQVRALATGTTDALRLVLPSKSTEVQVGDASQVGLDLSTSSFGKSSIHITGNVWRLVCLNGLRVPENIGQISLRHIGEPARLKAGLRDAIPTALTHASGLMNHWKKAISNEVTRVNELLESLRQLTLGERGHLEVALKKEHGSAELPARTSLYNFVNAVTGAAHEAIPARRLELESLAGRLLMQEARP
jgi:hypothetical protein